MRHDLGYPDHRQPVRAIRHDPGRAQRHGQGALRHGARRGAQIRARLLRRNRRADRPQSFRPHRQRRRADHGAARRPDRAGHSARPARTRAIRFGRRSVARGVLSDGQYNALKAAGPIKTDYPLAVDAARHAAEGNRAAARASARFISSNAPQRWHDHDNTRHHHRRHHRRHSAQGGYAGGAGHAERADRIDARGLRSRRHRRAYPRAQSRRDPELRPGIVRASRRRRRQALPGHDHAVLDRRPRPRAKRARQDAELEAAHGVARHRLGEFPGADLRKSAAARRGLARSMLQNNVKPEIEVFDVAMLYNAKTSPTAACSSGRARSSSSWAFPMRCRRGANCWNF